MTYAKDLVSGRSTSTSTATRERSADSAEQVRDLRVGVMRLARRLRLERDDSDLTFTQLAALATLERLGDTTIGELAAAENVKPPSMTRTINTLVDMELVTRRPPRVGRTPGGRGTHRRRRPGARLATATGARRGWRRT